jgi:two-component system phosphate regulon sensor histidine kinase PhoR
LALSSLESSTQSKPAQEPVNFSALCKQVLEDACNLSAGKHDIQGDIEKVLLGVGDSREIFSAFSNVASNAVRYTPHGGCISLRLHQGINDLQQACVFFTVQDTGIGIAAEHIPRLTERFYRVDRSRSRESGGTGLGLAIVKHVIQRHNGLLNIESRPNAGSRFVIQLPL